MNTNHCSSCRDYKRSILRGLPKAKIQLHDPRRPIEPDSHQLHRHKNNSCNPTRLNSNRISAQVKVVLTTIIESEETEETSNHQGTQPTPVNANDTKTWVINTTTSPSTSQPTTNHQMFPHLPHLLLLCATLFNKPTLARPRPTPPQNDLRIPELSVTLGSSENPQSDVTYASESSRFTNEPDTLHLDREGTEYGFYFSCVDVTTLGLRGKVGNVKMRMVTKGECRFYISNGKPDIREDLILS